LRYRGDRGDGSGHDRAEDSAEVELAAEMGTNILKVQNDHFLDDFEEVLELAVLRIIVVALDRNSVIGVSAHGEGAVVDEDGASEVATDVGEALDVRIAHVLGGGVAVETALASSLGVDDLEDGAGVHGERGGEDDRLADLRELGEEGIKTGALVDVNDFGLLVGVILVQDDREVGLPATRDVEAVFSLPVVEVGLASELSVD